MAFSIIWSIEGGIEQITATHVQHLETLLSQTLYIQPSTSNSSSLRLMSGRRRIWLSRVCFRCVYIGPHAYLTSYVWHNTRSRWIESLERRSMHAHMFPSGNMGKSMMSMPRFLRSNLPICGLKMQEIWSPCPCPRMQRPNCATCGVSKCCSHEALMKAQAFVVRIRMLCSSSSSTQTLSPLFLLYHWLTAKLISHVIHGRP